MLLSSLGAHVKRRQGEDESSPTCPIWLFQIIGKVILVTEGRLVIVALNLGEVGQFASPAACQTLPVLDLLDISEAETQCLCCRSANP